MKSTILIALVTCAMASTIGGFGCTDASPAKQNEAPPPPAPVVNAPGTLQGAHDAYLEGDFLTVGERVRDVLLDARSSELVKENALEVLDKAYEVQKGRLPSRFVLPPDFEGLKLGFVRGMSPQGPFNRIYLYGNVRKASRLKNITVKRVPGETLLDSTTHQGDIVWKHDKEGYETFVIERVVPALPGDGVVSLRFELDDGTAADGWIITHMLASSASPEIRTPSSSESITDTHPIVSWAPFRSPEYAPFEWRTLSVYVSRETTKDLAWDLWTKDYGELAEVRIGQHPAGRRTSLIPGDYWLNITCGEVRMFGPIAMARESRSVAPFHLVP